MDDQKQTETLFCSWSSSKFYRRSNIWKKHYTQPMSNCRCSWTRKRSQNCSAYQSQAATSLCTKRTFPQ